MIGVAKQLSQLNLSKGGMWCIAGCSSTEQRTSCYLHSKSDENKVPYYEVEYLKGEWLENGLE